MQINFYQGIFTKGANISGGPVYIYINIYNIILCYCIFIILM